MQWKNGSFVKSQLMPEWADKLDQSWKSHILVFGELKKGRRDKRFDFIADPNNFTVKLP
jgi:hypothetical protein